jgi:hypothetical protein
MMRRYDCIPPYVFLYLIVLCGFLAHAPRNARALQNDAHRPGAPEAERGHGISTRGSHPPLIQFFIAYPASSEVELSWVAFSDEDLEGFRIYRRKQSESYFLMINTEGLIPAWLQDYSDRDLPSATTYQYILGVVTSDGDEVFSQPVEVTTASKTSASNAASKRRGE